MTSYCVQLLAEDGQNSYPVRFFFTHEQGLADTERLAAARSAEVPGVSAYRILDMGGGVHAARILAEGA
jgi:hypothetical protein